MFSNELLLNQHPSETSWKDGFLSQQEEKLLQIHEK